MSESGRWKTGSAPQDADFVVTRELLEQWIKDAKNGDVYAVTSEGRLLRLCGALLAGEVRLDG